MVQKVEHAITARDGVVLRGQVVEAHQVQQRYAFHTAFGEVAVGRAARVAVVENVQHEVLRTDLVGPHVVDVLHHQVPNGHFGVHRCAFQQFGYQHVWCVDALVGELTHLVDVIRADDGVLVGNGQGLVGVEADIQ